MHFGGTVRFGYGLCLIGLLIAASSLIPGVLPKGYFNWYVIGGSAVYMPGAWLSFLSAKGKDRNAVINQLRFVRLGFLVIIVIWITMLSSGH